MGKIAPAARSFAIIVSGYPENGDSALEPSPSG